MVFVDGSTNVHLVGISTKAAVNMVKKDGVAVALDLDNRNNFCAMVARFEL